MRFILEVLTLSFLASQPTALANSMVVSSVHPNNSFLDIFSPYNIALVFLPIIFLSIIFIITIMLSESPCLHEAIPHTNKEVIFL